MINNLLSIHPKIKEALLNNKPVVALESSFIAHGLPYPTNLELCSDMASIIKKRGVHPAVTAIINGKIKIGLDDSEIEELANSGEKIFKASASDFGVLLAKGAKGATTVAGTIYAAHMAGIKIIVTGGIGGVHREGYRTLDISQDLNVLSSLPVTVVSAGAKAILDIKLTLEYIETAGVAVIGYKTNYFPSFYSCTSPYLLNHRAESAVEIAEIIQCYYRLKWQRGLLIANPLPDHDSLSAEYLNNVINKALDKAKELNISGKSLTPFLLNYIVDISEGKCLKANLSLLKNNAVLAADISYSYHELKSKNNF